MKPLDDTLLNLAVTSSRPVSASEYEGLGHEWRVKADRGLNRLVKQRSGEYEVHRRLRGQSKKIFVPNSLGLYRALLRHLEKVYLISGEQDRKKLLLDVAEVTQRVTFDSKSFMDKFRAFKEEKPFLFVDTRSGPIRLE